MKLCIDSDVFHYCFKYFYRVHDIYTEAGLSIYIIFRFMSFGTQLCVFDRHHLGNFPLPRIASVLSASCPYVKFVRGHMWSLGFF
jgi:uncharacterized membrane protein